MSSVPPLAKKLVDSAQAELKLPTAAGAEQSPAPSNAPPPLETQSERDARVGREWKTYGVNAGAYADGSRGLPTLDAARAKLARVTASLRERVDSYTSENIWTRMPPTRLAKSLELTPSTHGSAYRWLEGTTKLTKDELKKLFNPNPEIGFGVSRTRGLFDAGDVDEGVKDYDPYTAAVMVELASRVYGAFDKGEEIRLLDGWLRNQMGFHVNYAINDRYRKMELLPVETDSQALLLERADCYVAVLRGTESWTDVITDMTGWISPKEIAGGSVHEGFWQAYRNIRPNFDALKRHFTAQRDSAILDIEKRSALSFDQSSRLKELYRTVENKLTASDRDELAELEQESSLSPAQLADLKKLARRPDGYPDKPIYITGHSLGAAMSTLLALDMAEHGIPVKGAYLWSSPRVFTPGAADRYNGLEMQQSSGEKVKLGDASHREGLSSDPVRGVLPPAHAIPFVEATRIYKHIGHDYLLTSDGKMMKDLTFSQNVALFFQKLSNGDLHVLTDLFSMHRIANVEDQHAEWMKSKGLELPVRELPAPLMKAIERHESAKDLETFRTWFSQENPFGPTRAAY